MKLRACNSCDAHILSIDNSCPHCTPKSSSGRKIALAALLGFAMVGCGEKDEDSATSEPAEEPAEEPASEPAEEPSSEPAVEPEYGVAE